MTTVSIIGGSGYAGGELLRILLFHPQVHIKQITSRQFAGQPVSSAHPNLRKVTDLMFCRPDELVESDIYIVALPNGESMKYMEEYMKKSKKIIDLGADFRLRDKEQFTKWYGNHMHPEMLNTFVYGIAELHREEIKKAEYVSCGGCEATVSILALAPLKRAGIIEDDVIIDAKMSSSQAGMKASISSHHPERAGVVRSYMPTGHRHTAEIQQEVGMNMKVGISATALDMVRGLLVTIHAKPKEGITEKEVWKAYRAMYKNEPFIRLVKEKQGIYRYPEPKLLAGTNFCDIGFEMDAETNRLVIIAAIDNLVKGTAGQAVQALNIMCEYDETTALTFPGLHPI